MGTTTIKLSDPGSTTNPKKVKKVDKVRWENDTGHNCSAFTLPTNVSPQTNPAPLADGDKTIKYDVGGTTGTNYDYDFTIDDGLALRTGVIQPE